MRPGSRRTANTYRTAVNSFVIVSGVKENAEKFSPLLQNTRA